MIVGLTGGIATGKSTVSNMLKTLGAYVVDADVWARRVVEPGSEGLQEIVKVFGEQVLSPDGTLHRKALANLIFSDENLRKTLNSITHPRIRSGMTSETASYLTAHSNQPVIWDVPLLFEGDIHKMVDCSVLVYAPLAVQLTRLMERDTLPEPQALSRIEAQMPIDEKRYLATYVIDNTQDIENTRKQVEQLWTTIRSQASTGRA